MKKQVSALEQYLLNKGEKRGEKRGESNAILRFIQNRRKRLFSDMQIQNDLQADFELDETTARQYMAAAIKA